MHLIFGLLIQLVFLNNLLNACPKNCDCVNTMLRCYGAALPDHIPSNVSMVYIDSFNLDNLKPDQFGNGDWINVTILDIVADLGLQLKDNAFKGLENLEHLGLHGQQLQDIANFSLSGLDKVITLDLSENIKLSLKSLVNPFMGTGVLPAMRNITLARLNSFFTEPVKLDDDFVNAITHGRKINYMDITDLNIALLDFNSFTRYACAYLNYIKAQRINLAFPKDFIQPTCRSLKTLDISGAFLPIIATRKMDFANVDFNCPSVTFYFGIENLYLNYINYNIKRHLTPAITVNNFVLDMTACGFQLNIIEAVGNNLKWINMSVFLSSATQDNLEVLDLSDNILEYISPLALLPSINMKYLNMSHNQLHVMQHQFPTDFEQLFSSMSKLRRLYLANNVLADIPQNTFLNNSMLEYLDLSYNKLTRIGFNFEHLRSLRFLDLSHNLIKSIADDTQRRFKALHTLGYPYVPLAHPTQQPVEMQVDLSNNDYQCECGSEYFQYIDWLKTSSVVYKKNKTYECSLDGKRADILKSAYEETQEFCQAKKALQIVTVAIPTTLCLLLVTIVTAIVLLRIYRKKKNVKNVIFQIRNNKFPRKYLVFVSYCSENGDLVIDKMYPQLKQEIYKMTQSDKELVCLGDLHFRPGFAIHNEAMRCIENSTIVLLIISNNFCQKNWCKMEVGEAYAQRKPIIMLMTERVDTEIMSPFLRKIFNRYTHASWVNDEDGGHVEPDWKVLVGSMIELASENQRENNLPRNDFELK